MKLHNFLVMLLLLTGAVLFVACEGDRGPAGPAGKDGKDGVDGKDGAKGDKGDKGDKADSPAGGDSRCDRSNGLDIPLGTKFFDGTEDADVICGNATSNEIRAGAGDDTVYGGAGNDKLLGGSGDDTLYGEAGVDHFYIWEQRGSNKYIGGAGKDMIYFGKDNRANTPGEPGLWRGIYSVAANGSDNPNSDITFDLSSGTFVGSFSSRTGSFAFEGIEDVFGGDGGDTITGDDKDNYIWGGNGTDILNGGAGDDVLYGAGGNDTKDGGAGDDLLYAYNDTDTLTGGAGADTFVFEHWPTPGKHIIKDFDLTEDKIYLSGYPTAGRRIDNTGANLKAGTTTFAVIHKDGATSESHAEAIKVKASELIKFVTKPELDPVTRTYTFTDN